MSKKSGPSSSVGQKHRVNPWHQAPFAIALVLLVIGAVGCATPEAGDQLADFEAAKQAAELKLTELELAGVEQSVLEKEWGIKIIGIRQTAAGYGLDFRYLVLDPEKATPLLQRKYTRNPYLIVEKSGAKLGVPWSEKTGSLRQSVRTANQIKANKRYFVLFANPSRHVDPGDDVTVVIGEFRAEHITVQ